MSGERTETCGCRFKRSERGDKWLSMCEPHGSEYRERHERALADYRAARAVVESDDEAGSSPVRSPSAAPVAD